MALGTTLAADPTTLAPAGAGNKVSLVKAPFTPNENHVVADFTLADFTGSAALVAGNGAQPVGNDPLTAQQEIDIKEPAGGWRWQCTVAPTPAQTIYGYILTDNAGAVLLGMGLLDVPITVTAIGDFVEIGSIKLIFVLQPMS